MNISIVIPLRDDRRIETCLASIDETVEVVISLNDPSSEIVKLVNNLKNAYKRTGHISIKICRINYPSIAGAYNNGIKHSSHSKVLLMDSDCVFEKGAIKKMADNLGDSYLSKGRVVFTHNTRVTAMVGRAREFHTSDRVSAYSPPLLFRKAIKNKIGGYYFHPRLSWLEDSEFDRRVSASGLEISYDASAIVHHPPLTPIRDLKSAFWYGVGHQVGYSLGINVQPRGLLRSFYKYVVVGSRSKGVASGLYLMLWKIVLLSGFYTQSLFHLRKK